MFHARWKTRDVVLGEEARRIGPRATEIDGVVGEFEKPGAREGALRRAVVQFPATAREDSPPPPTSATGVVRDDGRSRMVQHAVREERVRGGETQNRRRSHNAPDDRSGSGRRGLHSTSLPKDAAFVPWNAKTTRRRDHRVVRREWT